MKLSNKKRGIDGVKVLITMTKYKKLTRYGKNEVKDIDTLDIIVSDS